MTKHGIPRFAEFRNLLPARPYLAIPEALFSQTLIKTKLRSETVNSGPDQNPHVESRLVLSGVDQNGTILVKSSGLNGWNLSD
jgi:hypothetical protein